MHFRACIRPCVFDLESLIPVTHLPSLPRSTRRFGGVNIYGYTCMQSSVRCVARGEEEREDGRQTEFDGPLCMRKDSVTVPVPANPNPAVRLGTQCQSSELELDSNFRDWQWRHA